MKIFYKDNPSKNYNLKEFINNYKTESENEYKTDFTDYLNLEFIYLPEDNKIEIDFINKEDDYYVGVFEVDVDEVNWSDDESVCNFISREIVTEVLSNYLYHYEGSEDYQETFEVCKAIEQISKEFENLLNRSDVFEPNIFSYVVEVVFKL